MTPPLLAMTGISKRFPGVTALDSVAFEAERGEVVALVGENGAGKSTLMRVLAGIERPDAGEMRLEGVAVHLHSPRAAANLGIALIHQELELIDSLDIASNIFLGRELRWGGPLGLLDRRRMDRESEAYLQRMGLERSPRTRVEDLSTAERQLVEISRALSMNARLVIMDEPTSSLTTTETERLFSVVRDLKTQGVAVVYISHRMAEVEAVADRVVVLRDGRNAGALKRDQIQRETMIRMMVGRDLQPVPARRETSPPTAPLLEVRGLRTQRYPQHAIDLEFHPGEILGIAGLVGAGRSELLRAIFGAERRLAGSIRVQGKAVPASSPKDAIANGIFLLPEERRTCGLLTSWSVRKNITLPGLRRFSSAGMVRPALERATATRLSDALRIKTPSVETAAAHLSGGNQQKVVLAKGLSLNPKALLFDEPTRGVDVGSKAEIHGLMRQLARAGAAVVMASSDMEEILGVTDRIAVMHEGRVMGILRGAECSAEAVMRLAVAE